ncbi:cell division protein FtsL [Clostridium tarantellae]|uniref:Cell division protein FtsL n=1 Tax=Clostridium tarantellae TaxID=39493 RepID=A0A6I1MH59_9CLOT|nr:cell division protein FtsL [Clostridium tarantellae]MPQ42164.1 cell division protein FtsL [Clostridium tarantellae]
MRKKFNIKNIVMITLIAIFCISIVRQELTMKRINSDIQGKQKQLQDLKNKNERLQEEVNQSTTDEYIERLARERLGMIKPGEKVIVNSDKTN